MLQGLYLFGDPCGPLLEILQLLFAPCALPALHVQVGLADQLGKPLGLSNLPAALPEARHHC